MGSYGSVHNGTGSYGSLHHGMGRYGPVYNGMGSYGSYIMVLVATGPTLWNG